MTADKPQSHKTTNITGTPITKLQKRYNGNPGDMTILYHDCECGERHAFEYGTTEHMREVWKRLMGKQK